VSRRLCTDGGTSADVEEEEAAPDDEADAMESSAPDDDVESGTADDELAGEPTTDDSVADTAAGDGADADADEAMDDGAQATSASTDGGDPDAQEGGDDMSVLGSFGDDAELGLAGNEYVSFRSGGQIAPNKYVSNRRFAGKHSLVFLYNPETEMLFMKPLSKEEHDHLQETSPEAKTKELNIADDGRMNPFSARELLQQWGLSEMVNRDHTVRYLTEWNTEHQAVAVDLSDDPEVLDRTATGTDDSADEDATDATE
jgi:hypothetical protein